MAALASVPIPSHPPDDLPAPAQTAHGQADLHRRHPNETERAVARDPLTQAFLALLHRGGAWAFIWTPDAGETKDKKRSCWVPVGQPLTPPKAWQSGRNLHFGVNPSTLPRKNYQASINDTIAAINCLYAEFDGKDFSNPTSAEIAEHFALLRCDPARLMVKDDALWKEASNRAKEAKFATDIASYKFLALAHVQHLTPAPSVIVDSGGG